MNPARSKAGGAKAAGAKAPGGRDSAGKAAGKALAGKGGGRKVPSAKPASQRQLRVAEEIRHVLAGVFGRGEIRDPDLSGVNVTVTEVRIGPDLKRATAFVTRLGRSDVAEKLPALRRAAPYLRACVAKELKLRHAPDLSFQADTSIDYAMHVDSLLRAPDVARDLAHDAAPDVAHDLAHDAAPDTARDLAPGVARAPGR